MTRLVSRGVRAAVVTLAALAACAEGKLPTGPAPGAAYTRLALDVRVSAAAAGRSLSVAAAYARVGTPGLIPLDSATVALGATPAAMPLQLNVSACVMDPQRELPNGTSAESDAAKGVCVLHLTVTLLDASGAPLSQATLAVVTTAGAQETPPPVTLGGGS